MFAAGPVFNTNNASGNAQITNVNGDLHVVQNVCTMAQDQEHRIYEWLDAPDSSGNFLAARQKHHENTGAWFIEGEEYLRWKETPDSALWLYGTPGSGKTIICSTVIEQICEVCEASPTFACAYFFFDNRNAQTDLSLHDRLIRSMVRQLSHQSPEFPVSLVELYSISGGRQPSIKALQRVIEKIIVGFERTYIIIDAVDECSDRVLVLAWIERLTKCRSGNLQVQILFSSRPERDIEDYLQSIVSLARVTLNSRLAEQDIETYIDAMLSILIRKWDAQTMARVRDALITRSDGMFRWVALQISELFKCATRRAVDNQLQDLPQDLEGMYERSLLKSPHRQDLKRFLMWLAFSFRPLQTKELLDVVTVDLSPGGPPSYDPDLQYFGPADMLITCSSFVAEIEKNSLWSTRPNLRVMKLAHMSVKDYLVSDRLKNGPASYFSINTMLAHSLITKTCLAYLFHLRSLRSINYSALEPFPLATYAARYWIDHMRLGGGEDEHLSQIMHCIFSLEESALVIWVRLEELDQTEGVPCRQNYEEESAATAAPLYYACMHGLQRIAHQLLIDAAPVNAQGPQYGNALQAASCGGHHDIVRLLLENGAWVNAQGGSHGSALQGASSGGYDNTVRLLLEKGAYVNAQGGFHKNALQAASLGGHDTTVRLLIEEGADVNARGGHYGHALQVASLERHHGIMRLLLEQGADVNAKGGYFGHALQAASYVGSDATVRLLLDEGADVNANGGHFGSALQAASSGRHNSTVALLLEQGADVNAKGGYFGNALQGASYEGCVATVRLLLERGANVNAKGGHCGNALQGASFASSSDDTIVRLLLGQGSDINAKGGHYGNALQAASSQGSDATVHLLLGQGADVNVKGGYFGHALQAASSGGHDSTVRLLIDHGADVNAKGGHFGSALEAARYEAPTDFFSQPRHEGHELTVRILLEYGDIDDDDEGKAKKRMEDEKDK